MGRKWGDSTEYTQEWQRPLSSLPVHYIMMEKLSSLYLPSRTKLWCTLQLRGQIHSLYFFSTPMYSVGGLHQEAESENPPFVPKERAGFKKTDLHISPFSWLRYQLRHWYCVLESVVYSWQVFPAGPSENNRVLENKYSRLLIGKLFYIYLAK